MTASLSEPWDGDDVGGWVEAHFMLQKIKQLTLIKKLRKSLIYSRVRQHLPMREVGYVDDRDRIDDAEAVTMDWPTRLKKPSIGIVQDYGEYPRWTKYCRFLEKNAFHYHLYNIHAQDWMEKGRSLDLIIGIPSSEGYHLEEIRKKYYVLEVLLGKRCYPSAAHAMLFEDKTLEADVSQAYGIPFVPTHVTYDKEEAIHLVETLKYPVVCKIVPSAGSEGTEFVGRPSRCRKIVRQAFSRNGRKTHVIYFRQKNYVYFQDYVPNHGYDIRCITVGNRVFGYYRKVLRWDFRASGMDLLEKRELPEQAIRMARQVNKIIKSPMLVVDMLHGLDGKYSIIEFSPLCRMETPEQLHVNGVPGAYVFDNDDSFHFETGRYWAHELALREFLLNDYLPWASGNEKKIPGMAGTGTPHGF